WHSSTQVGVVIAAIGAGGVLGTILYGWIGHRFRRWVVYAWSFLFFAAPTFLTVAVDPPGWILVPLVLLFAVGFGPLNPLGIAVGYDRAPVGLRGRVFGVISSGSFAIMPLGPVVAGLLLDTIGLTITMFTLALVALAVTVLPFVFPVWRDMDTLRSNSEKNHADI